MEAVRFSLSPELKSFQETLERFSREKVRPRAAEADEAARAPADLLRELHRLGYSRCQFPEKYGGLGQPGDCLPAAVLAAGAIAKGCAGIALAAPGPGPIAHLLLAAGTEEQKRAILPRFADSAPAFAGYSLGVGVVPPDFSRIEVEARSERAGYVLQGKQNWVVNFDRADLYLITARIGPSQPGGRGWFLIEKDTPGLEIKNRVPSMGLCAVPFGELSLAECRVSLVARIGENVPEAELDAARVPSAMVLAALAAGIIEAGLDYTLEYAEDRVQFGGPIIEREAIGLMLTGMKQDLELGRSLLFRAAGELDASPAALAQAVLAAAYLAERVAPHLTNALQILGGYGFIRDYPCEKWLRDAKTLEVLMGATERQKLWLLERLRRPRSKPEAIHG